MQIIKEEVYNEDKTEVVGFIIEEEGNEKFVRWEDLEMNKELFG